MLFLSLNQVNAREGLSDILKKLETIETMDLSGYGQCQVEEDPSHCPPVHVGQWCREQYELIKSAPKSSDRPFIKRKSGKSVVFLGEEHGDEQAYSYYEKLLSEKKYGFDCLFLELPSVFQKNFESKKGIIHEGRILKRLDKKKADHEVTQIELIDSSYISLLEGLAEVARENKVKIVLVDSSNKDVLSKNIVDSLMERNQHMAKNIMNSFEMKECSHGLSIKGSQHLFVQNALKNLSPVDEVFEDLQKSRNKEEKVETVKAMIYSPSSENFNQSMGPCSWLNVLPETEESYYEGKVFFEKRGLFPEAIQKTMSELYGGDVNSDVDFAIVLPAQLDKQFLVKTLNRRDKKVIPKKYKAVHELKMESNGIHWTLRSNPWSLNISNQEGLSGFCYEKCQQEKLSFEELVIKDVIYRSPSIECRGFHPSRTGGAAYAPLYKTNLTVIGECYCK